MFDPTEAVPHASIPYEVNDCEAHRDLARAAARESMVLLKNQKGLLPLSRDIRSVAVIGPNANDPQVLVGNYFGIPSQSVTPLQGIRAAVSKETKVWYSPGCKHLGTKQDGLGRAGDLAEAKSMAERSDAIILCLGLNADIEGEQGDAGNSEAAGDKRDLSLTGLQQPLLEMLTGLGKPTVLVLLSGSALDLRFAHERVGAILQAWYPGGEAGTALAEILFGDASPAGRLPITFPMSVEDVPDIRNYSMKGRTYRYLEKEPLYPFGYGLSYARFVYDKLALSQHEVGADDVLEVSVKVHNLSERSADEVVQLYVKEPKASCTVPHHELRGFQRVTLDGGESKRVSFQLAAKDLSHIDEQGRRIFEAGPRQISVGGSQPDARSIALTGQSPLSGELHVKNGKILPY
jgi:beta-glucosidase